MRLFRTAPRERPLTTMLREMEYGRFPEAYKALKRDDGRLPAPPHALARLGRWLAERNEPRKALLPLRRFLESYPRHQDIAVVRDDHDACLRRLGRRR